MPIAKGENESVISDCVRERERERERESLVGFLFFLLARVVSIFCLHGCPISRHPSFRLSVSLSLSLSLSNPLPLTLSPLSTRPRECEVKRFKTISLSPVSVRLSPNIFKSTAHIQVRTTPTSNLLTDVT